MTVPGTRPTFSNAVQLGGQVHRPGTHQFRNGLRLTDLIPSIDELRPNADLHYVLIRREHPGTRRIQAFSADLEQAWLAPMSEANPLLAARGPGLRVRRRDWASPIPRAGPGGTPASGGEQRAIAHRAGHWPRAGRGGIPARARHDRERPDPGRRRLAEQAFGGDAELARYEVREDRTRRTEVIKVDLARVLQGDAAADLVLRPFDTLVVKEISEWAQQEFVRLEGEVRFPGQYPIARGETLRSVIARAGGLTSLAFAQGSVFTRETLKERERQADPGA